MLNCFVQKLLVLNFVCLHYHHMGMYHIHYYIYFFWYIFFYNIYSFLKSHIVILDTIMSLDVSNMYRGSLSLVY